MRRTLNLLILFLIPVLLLSACKKENPESNNQNPFDKRDFGQFGGKDFGMGMMFGEGVESIEVQDQIKTLSEDCVENYFETTTLAISFNGKNAISNGKFATENGVTLYKDEFDKTVTLSYQKEESGEKSEAQGVTIEYKGSNIIRYVLSGSLEGTLKIKSKNADCIIELNGFTINSSEKGPALQLTSEEYRTFLVVSKDTENTIIDNRELNQNDKILNDKKGSVYAKGPLIITGSTSKTAGGNLTIVNKGYKHAIYSHDYLRIANVNLNVNCDGETSRDCIRTLNAVIIDGGNINLVTKGCISDAEGCGIKVEGEDVDDDNKETEYTAGAGFVVINGGNITIESSAKGITANWKKTGSAIEKEDYKKSMNKSLLYQSGVLNADAKGPEPYFIMNGGNLEISTKLLPYERNDASCSPEGIEAKYDVIINGGTILVNATDDAINSGAAVSINGGNVTAQSSTNDAIDANGPSGILINGGQVWCAGTNVPECAFDSDQNPFVINGGTVVGYGSTNITMPSDQSSQKVVAIGTSGYSGKALEVSQNGKSIITCDLPSDRSDVLIFSSDALKDGDFAIYVDGAEVSTGEISGVVTKINVSEGIGGFGGGFGGFNPFDGNNMPEGRMPPNGRGQPPAGFPNGGERNKL